MIAAAAITRSTSNFYLIGQYFRNYSSPELGVPISELLENVCSYETQTHFCLHRRGVISCTLHNWIHRNTFQWSQSIGLMLFDKEWWWCSTKFSWNNNDKNNNRYTYVVVWTFHEHHQTNVQSCHQQMANYTHIHGNHTQLSVYSLIFMQRLEFNYFWHVVINLQPMPFSWVKISTKF